MEEVSLQEMLAARERRSALQTRLLQQYKKSLISFTLNIPGPVKVPDGVPQAFAAGCRRIEALLKDRLVLVQHMETIKEKTGYEAFYCIDAVPPPIRRYGAQRSVAQRGRMTWKCWGACSWTLMSICRKITEAVRWLHLMWWNWTAKANAHTSM